MRGSRAAILVLMVFLVACLTLVLAGPVLAAGGARDVTVDAGKVTGAIRSLQGAHWDPGVAGSTLNDIYLSLGVDAVRTHDAGGIDSNGVGDIDGFKAIDAIFPDFSKDPNAASSYNFGTDRPADQEHPQHRGASVLPRRADQPGRHRLRQPGVVQQLRARH